MAKIDTSTKRVAISKANAQMLAAICIAAFVSVFCLFAAKSVWSQNSYQAKIVTNKEKANTQLKKNIEAYSRLARSYKSFNAATPNVIGGVPEGTGDNDGANSKIILDSLPSSYDFPALTSSIERLIAKNGQKLANISGTDDQVNQQSAKLQATPKEVPMPFALSVKDIDYAGVQKLVSSLQQSIRPIQIDTLSVSGGGNSMSVIIEAHTYYQPGKDVTITKKVIK